MLVLTRKLQEQIKIGDQVTVTILKIKGGTVRVGIHAPRDVRVVRGELPRKDEVAAEVACETALVAAETVAAVDAMPIASDGPPAETVISFRIPRDAAEAPLSHAETTTQVSAANVSAGNISAGNLSAAHLPLRRIHDRMGGGPLKQLMTSCAMLDT
jgi:carbon storage regulator